MDIINYKKKSGNDNIFYKEIVKKKLIANEDILKALNNKELDVEESDSFLGVNILPYYFLMDKTQRKDMNFICFDTSFSEVSRYNDILKTGQIIFYILCDVKDIFDKETGIARHDLLSALITDEFNWCTDFGTRIKLVSDTPYAVDDSYILRTLVFEQQTLNSITYEESIINNDR